ncbi:MAG: LysM peptidoglycan-binding domain-containing protein [Verrucomicrobiota bacterium]
MRGCCVVFALWVISVSSVLAEELFTNAYSVPPALLNTGGGKELQNAKQYLEEAGISFPEGASAIFLPNTSQLIVRNTQEQMELVEALIDSIQNGVEKQIYLTFREVSVSEGVSGDLGFDWLLEPSSEKPRPESGRVIDSLEEFKEELSRPPGTKSIKEIGDIGIGGVFTDPQFQVLIRALNQEEGVELMQAPSVMARSGQPVLSEVGDRRYGVIPVIGADSYTIDLEVFLPEHGEALLKKGEPLETPIQITIWDGQTVAIARKDREGQQRVIFVKAQLMDPAGVPINEAPGDPIVLPTAKLSGESREKLGQLVKRVIPFNFHHANTHVVEEGESLYAIATDAGAMISEIKRLNGLEKDDIEVGQLLFLPADSNVAIEESFTLNEVVIPEVDFKEAALVEALGFVQEMLLSHEKVDNLFPKEAPRIILKEAAKFDDTEITLRLSNVPVREALRYITEMAQCEYEIKGSRIYVFPRAL